VLHFFVPPNIGEHLALPYKASRRKDGPASGCTRQEEALGIQSRVGSRSLDLGAIHRRLEPLCRDVIRKEAWPFYRTIPGVRLCWKLEEPKGPKGAIVSCPIVGGPSVESQKEPFSLFSALQGYLAHKKLHPP